MIKVLLKQAFRLVCILWCCIIKRNASKKGLLGLLLLSKKLVRPMFLRGEHTIRLVPIFILNCLRDITRYATNVCRSFSQAMCIKVHYSQPPDVTFEPHVI